MYHMYYASDSIINAARTILEKLTEHEEYGLYFSKNVLNVGDEIQGEIVAYCDKIGFWYDEEFLFNRIVFFIKCHFSAYNVFPNIYIVYSSYTKKVRELDEEGKAIFVNPIVLAAI